MAKDSYWFRHDSTAGRGTRMRKMAFIYGHWGKGIYWDVIEMLRDQADYSFPKSEFDLKMLCDLIGCKDETKFINWYRDCVKFELFIEQNDVFYSEVLRDHMMRWESSKSNGYKGGKPKRNPDVTQPLTQIIPNTKPKRNHNRTVHNSTIDNKSSFDLFWSKYPTKVSKQKTKSLFLKLTEPEVQTILNTIDSFVKHKPFPEYTHPHPTTYLNQKRWQDEIPNTLPDKTKPQITRDVWFIARQIPAQKQKLCSQYQLTDQEFDNLYK